MLGAVSDLGVALITGGFTIGAVVVTFGGNALLERARARRASGESRDAAIAEVLAASIDLVLAVAAIRAAHEHRTNRRMRLFIAAALLRDLPDLDSWKAFTDRSVQRVALSTLTGLAREQDADTRMMRAAIAANDATPRRPESAGSVFEIGGGAQRRVSRCRRDVTSQVSALQRRIQQGCARSCSSAGRWQAGWRVSEETGARVRPGPGRGATISRHRRVCRSWPCSSPAR